MYLTLFALDELNGLCDQALDAGDMVALAVLNRHWFATCIRIERMRLMH